MVGCPPPWMYGSGVYQYDPVGGDEEPGRKYLPVKIADDEQQISAAEYLILDSSDDDIQTVLFVVGTLVMEADLVWVAVQSEGGNWLLRILAVLPAMALYLLIAEFLYFASTRDLTGELVAPPDE